MIGKKVEVYKTHLQETLEYEGVIIAFSENETKLPFLIKQENGKITTPFPSLCRIKEEGG